MGMRMNICTSTGMGMCTDMCTDMCMGMRFCTCVDIRMRMVTDMCMNLGMGICSGMALRKGANGSLYTHVNARPLIDDIILKRAMHPAWVGHGHGHVYGTELLCKTWRRTVDAP